MRYFYSFLFRNKETVSKNNCLGYWNISRIPHSQYVCYRSKKVKSLSKSYFLNIRPWWELHWFLQVMSPPICSSQTPPFIIIMLGLLYCGESFSIINMIRFVIISSSDEQACKLLHPKNVLHVHTSNKTKREESSINLILSMCCWLEWCRRQNLLLSQQLRRLLSLFFPHLLLRCHTSANSRRTSV